MLWLGTACACYKAQRTEPLSANAMHYMELHSNTQTFLPGVQTCMSQKLCRFRHGSRAGRQ